MIRTSEFLIADVEIEATENYSDGGVGAEGVVVGGGHGATVGGVGAAEEVDVFGAEFGFDAGLAEDVDPFRRGQLEDSGDVDCRGVCGAKDFVLG